MEIRTTEHLNMRVLRPAGRIDSATAPEFEKDLLERIQSGQTNLVVDFSDVEYISSAGLRVLLIGAKRVKPLGGRLVLCCMRETIREVFEISGFLTILPLFPTLDEACQPP